MKRIHRLHTYLKIDLSKRSLFNSIRKYSSFFRNSCSNRAAHGVRSIPSLLSRERERKKEVERRRKRASWRQIALKRRSAITRRAMNNESTRDQSGKRSAPPLSPSLFFLSRNKIARSLAKYSRSRRERWRGKVEKVGEEEVN